MSAQILIVTRMAIAVNARPPSGRWLSTRLMLMRSVTIPSVTRAVEVADDVRWIWLSAPEHVNRLVDESRHLDFIEVVEQGALTVPVRSDDPVVAVRIDSDDVLDPDLYLELRDDPPSVGTLLEIMNGYQLVAESGRLGRFRMKTSPPPIFALGMSHDRAIDVERYHSWGRKPTSKRMLDRRGSFIQTVGHGNILNRWRVTPDDEIETDVAQAVLERYGIELSDPRTSTP